MTSDNTRDDDGRRGVADAAFQLVVREATRVPLVALSVGMQVWERTRGLRESTLRHGAVALQLAAHTPLGRFLPQPDLDDGAQDEAARIVQHARESRLTSVATGDDAPSSTTRTTSPANEPAAKPAKAAATPAKTATKTASKAPASKPPAPAEPSEAAIEAGAPGVVTEQVEQITEQVAVSEPQSRDDLPIPDFDNVSIGSLRARLRSLDVEQLVTLREWEQAHAHRLPVITLLDNRIAKVAADAGTGTTTATGPAGVSAAAKTEKTATAKPAKSTPYPAEGSAPASGTEAADRAEAAAEDEGGTLRV
jgi:hypothetical protein